MIFDISGKKIGNYPKWPPKVKKCTFFGTVVLIMYPIYKNETYRFCLSYNDACVLRTEFKKKSIVFVLQTIH